MGERTVAMAGLPSGEGWALTLPDDPLPAEAGGRILACPGLEIAARPVVPLRAQGGGGHAVVPRARPGSRPRSG